MTKYERILNIEEEIRQIFAKDTIKKIDVFKANKLFDTWKLLNDYIPDSRSVIQESSLGILDDEPGWIKNPNFIKKL